MQNRSRSRSPLLQAPNMQPLGILNNECLFLFVGNLPVNWYNARIRQFIANCCKSNAIMQSLKYITVLKDENRKSKGECVIEFTSAHACAIAMTIIRGVEVEGKTIVAMPDTGAILRKDAVNDRIPKAPSVPNSEPQTDRFETYGLSVNFLESLNIKPPLRSKVFVANLNNKVTEPGLRELFSHAGQVVSVILFPSNQGGGTKVNAKIEFDHPVEAVQAISMFNERVYLDNVLCVKMDVYAHLKQNLPPGLASMGPGLGPNGEPLRGIRHVIELEPIKQMLLQELSKIQSWKTKSQEQNPNEANLVLPQMEPAAGLTNVNYQNTVAGMNNPLNIVGQSGLGLLGQMQTLGLLQPNLGYATSITDLQTHMSHNVMQNYMGQPQNQMNVPLNQLNYTQNQMNDLGNPANIPQTHLNMTQNHVNSAQNQVNAAQNIMAVAQNPLSVAQNQINVPQKPVNVQSPQLANMTTSQLINFSQNQFVDSSKSQVTKSFSAGHQSDWSTKFSAHSKTVREVEDEKDYDDNDGRYSESSKYGKDTAGRHSDISTRKSKERNAMTSSDMLVFKNLPSSVTAKALTSKMSEVGELRYVDITGEGRAIVRFNEVRDAARCLKLFDRSKVDGQTISVNYF